MCFVALVATSFCFILRAFRNVLVAYIGLLLYFRGKGGYKPVVLDLKQ